VIGALLAYAWRRPALYAQMLVALLTAELGARALKELVDRDRPTARFPTPEPLVHVPHSSSFPSAHAATAFACATTLAGGASRRLAALLYLLATAIAYSRVYVGVHYPLDVLAGAALGVLVAVAVRILTGRGRSLTGRARGAGLPLSRSTDGSFG
jgi:membrane-associated phospholipid phosphatase